MKTKVLSLAAIAFLGFATVSNAQTKNMKQPTSKSASPLLKRDNAVILLVDHQVGLLTGVRDMSTADVRKNVVALAKAAKALGVPVIVTAVSDGPFGETLPELTAALPGVTVIKRSSINAWDDARVKQAVEATGRKQLIVAGISLEVCAGFPAMSAAAEGYDVSVVLDASGTFSAAKREAGIQRLTLNGIALTDYCTVGVELLGSNADPKAGEVYGALDMDFSKSLYQLNVK